MIQVVTSFFMAFCVCYLAMPSIIRIAISRGIVDAPDYRKSHHTVTPSFGGVGIFLGFSLITLLLVPSQDMDQLRYILAALFVIFLVGARDDLDPLSPLAKLTGQLIGIGLLMFSADIRLTSLQGIFGFYELNIISSYILTGTLFVFLINSFNLLDGIDALCASISILILSIIGTWFLMVGEVFYSILAITTAGATLAFLKYNISPSKIFMGDTGSLLLGAVCSISIIKMLQFNIDLVLSDYRFDSVMAIAIGLLILPVFDTTRVFLLRILKGKSPFLPDKNHIHHLLLDLGLSHMQSTALLLLVNTGFLLLSIQLQEINATLFIFISLAIAIGLYQILMLSLSLKKAGVIRTEP
ncbi:MAG: UDP-GlcNAc:undecaprenyl-phosphate GlcNAc-1-phosphate transferase [Saprospiraceae bacterium]|jgi:UDP-GlcNAc:undecaprenyl-phosphate GlcNAc-1-phosphate transferase